MFKRIIEAIVPKTDPQAKARALFREARVARSHGNREWATELDRRASALMAF